MIFIEKNFNKIVVVAFCVIVVATLCLFTFVFSPESAFKWQSQAKINQADLILPEEPIVLAKKLKIYIFGDAMLDRGVLLAVKKANDFNFPFLNIDSFLADADLRVMNLEGPITDFPSRALKDNRMIFTFPPDYLDALKNRFDVVNLANNHTLNFGYGGLTQTKDFLTRVGINFFGAPDNNREDLSAVVEKNGIKIGFLGYNSLAKKDMTEISTAVGELKQRSDFVIVYPHWGNEYQSIAAPSQRKEAQALIDAGADLIVGSHPHVIQNIEEYKDKIILYSLGNFIFDQYFSEETMQGLAVGIFLEKGDSGIAPSYKLFPIQINKQSQPELADFETAQKILMQISKDSLVDEPVKNSIKDGVIKLEGF